MLLGIRKVVRKGGSRLSWQWQSEGTDRKPKWWEGHAQWEGCMASGDATTGKHWPTAKATGKDQICFQDLVFYDKIYLTMI